MKEIKSLIELTNERLEKNSNEIEILVNLNQEYNVYKTHCIENKINYEIIDSFLNIINFRLFLNFLRGDLCSVLNSYNKANTTYEARFSTRNFVVIINEGLKKIYNFTSFNDDLSINKTQRNKSFWIKDLKPLVYDTYNELIPEFENITTRLNIFLENDFQHIKKYRDLSIHYDKNALEIFWMIVKIEYSIIEKYAIGFLEITNRMVKLTEDLLEIVKNEIDIKFS